MGSCFIILILAAHVIVIYGRSDGTIPSSACESMMPGHGTNLPQPTESPYSVYAVSAYFVQNIYLRVELEAHETSIPFKGYFCQARTHSDKIVGEFSVVGNSSAGHSCRSQPGVFDTVSHSDSWSQNPRRRVSLFWKVSTPPLENVIIRCTFVQNYSTFWVDVESHEIGPIQNSTYEECCDEEAISPQCYPLCKDIYEPAEDDAINILNNTIYGSGMCDSDSARLALRCSYWAQPGFQLDPAVVRDCCGDEVMDHCKPFCNKNLYAAVSYPDLDYTDCFMNYPELIYCVLQPAEGGYFDPTSYPIYGTDESSTVTIETTDDFYTSLWTTTDEDITTKHAEATSSRTASTGAPLEKPGRAVFTIITTVEVDGAVEDATLRENVFQALENDLLIPALDKVQGYVEVRTGVDYYEGSLVVSSEGVYNQQSDGSVPSTDDVKFQLDKRLQDSSDTIAQGPNAWKITPPVEVSHKDINGQCENINCADGETCVEVGPSGTTCVCESASCNDAQPGLSTGALVGIIVGVVVFLIIVGVIIYVWIRRRSPSAKKDKHHRASARSNHSYEDPVYMDISNVQPKPPELPPDRSFGNLPSNSVTYETPSDDVAKGQEQSFRKISDGYVVGVTKEKTDDHSNNIGEYGYAAYEVKDSAKEKAHTYNDYDDHHIKTASPAENSATKQNVARYESLSGYERAVDPDVRL